MQSDALSPMENVADVKLINSLSTDVFQRSSCKYIFRSFIILKSITPIPLPASFYGSLCYIAVHKYKVACAACHAE